MNLAAGVLRPSQPLLRDPGALASSVAPPQITVFGEDAYPTLALKAAVLLYSIVHNHPLVDGNKRLGWVSARWLCELNGHDLRILDQTLIEEFVIDVVTGVMDVEKAAEFITQHWQQI